ncbi:MAG: hypothetical protein Q8O01_02910 [Candidatus Omnitrophota bacterium]|nr:hypothetical protein [Candidatus Omnitrophota bacterium]
MKKRLMCLSIVWVIMATLAVPVFSQDSQTPAVEDSMPAKAPQAVAQAPQAAPAQEAAVPSELSIYGEVQTVNVQAASMTVQYYDYDNDEEKTLEVALDKDSKLENAKAIDEIKKGDWADVTYVVTSGKNIARSISVEKEDLSAEENAPSNVAEE